MSIVKLSPIQVETELTIKDNKYKREVCLKFWQKDNLNGASSTFIFGSESEFLMVCKAFESGKRKLKKLHNVNSKR